jgi:hypothetical protein
VVVVPSTFVSKLGLPGAIIESMVLVEKVSLVLNRLRLEVIELDV